MHSLRRPKDPAGRTNTAHNTRSFTNSHCGRWGSGTGLGLLVAVLILSLWVAPSLAMDKATRQSLQEETIELFYHGYDNYLQHAFPEDELRPVTCSPLTRDRDNAAHVELNDVLGNYSLTLIDSLSTLAIMASSSSQNGIRKRDPLGDFQDGVQLLIEYYGDGSKGSEGQGKRARGFDLDSKVQVFETVIRGVGGLLSAHLFAVGALPIRGYDPKLFQKNEESGIHWKNGLIYDGQLLLLAKDLAERLLPAFYTSTGLPYPRVNLRHGVPFYPNSPINVNAESGECPKDQSGREITETCSAGAGSLVLEFSTLSRLTGDDRFEVLGKNAFWAVWKRRSAIGLIGSGIDSETGQWVHAFTGIGAGIDSFFEYALKSHILLSGLPYNVNETETHSPDEFLRVWNEAHDSIRRHVYRGQMFQHPHYIQSDLYTGAPRAYWIDSLSAYYPGLLTLSGEIEEATAAHLLYTALWSRYAALPERWSTATGEVEAGLRWWGGRPEFVESSWYLYRATKDPWYLHIGEMVLSDIKRRCWTNCGWAGLQDVNTGEKNDRMESFFLGETAKYLYLLFDQDHPLNSLDAPFVFTTEGHPLIIPRPNTAVSTTPSGDYDLEEQPVCQMPPEFIPLTQSATAAREDIFHAAYLAKTHLKQRDELPNISPSNYSYFPWTLPLDLIPPNGTCSALQTKLTFDLSFPTLPDSQPSLLSIQRVIDGVYVSSISGIRFGMVKEREPVDGSVFRIYSVSSVTLGRDELVFLNRHAVLTLNPVDHYFTRVRDTQRLDFILDLHPDGLNVSENSTTTADELDEIVPKVDINLSGGQDPGKLSSFIKRIESILKESLPTTISTSEPAPAVYRHVLEAALPTGPGAAPLESLDREPPALADTASSSPLLWTAIYFAPHDLCFETLPSHVPREYQVIVVPRGGCSFATKLHHIASFPPSSKSLQVVVVISYPEHDNGVDSDYFPRSTYANHPVMIQPYLDSPQMTPAGLPRQHPIPLILLSGGDETMSMLERAGGVALRRRWWFESQGVRIENLIVL